MAKSLTNGIESKTGKGKITVMASDKKPAAKKQPTGYRLRDVLQPLAEKLAERRAYTVTDLVNEAIRKELEREGLWPIATEQKNSSPT